MYATLDVVKIVSNGSNRAILAALAEAPSYARALARRVGLTEGEVQRRLRRMEIAGLVRGGWRHAGKTIKEYRLLAAGLDVRFADGAVLLREA